mmetsp:Transcript_1306/g.2603  ORF Transcript_1306/g.2603 Transcript_1306/m.2603 type:complete len:280 (-) Transcript_1306:1813-2652(-)
MMDAPRPETALGNLEPAPFAKQHVAGRHAHIVEDELGMAVGRIVRAENLHRTDHFHARRVHWHKDHALLLVLLGLEVTFPHDDQYLATRIGGAGGPPLAPVDHVVVSVAQDRGLHVGRIRRGHVRLGHAEGGADFSGQQRLQPFGLLLRGAVLDEHLHVAGVGRVAIEYFRPDDRAAHDLGQGRVIEVVQPRAVLLMGAPEVPQPLGPRLGLQLLHDRRNDPAVVGGLDIGMIFMLGRDHMALHEIRNALFQCRRLGVEFEIHAVPPRFSAVVRGRSCQ